MEKSHISKEIMIYSHIFLLSARTALKPDSEMVFKGKHHHSSGSFFDWKILMF